MDEAKTKFERGTISKLALITKQKESGALKHRLIIDLLRSGGNGLAKVPERIVLPRVKDVVQGIQDLWKLHGGRVEEPDFRLELVGADLSDAYCHLGVAEGELKHCLAPAVGSQRLVLFKAMLFGFRGAPLIMGRLAAAMTRQWQSTMEGKASIQCYMDDPLLIIAGDQKERDSMVSKVLYLARVFGINLSYAKGERGSRVVWIGVTIEIDQEGRQILISVPQKIGGRRGQQDEGLVRNGFHQRIQSGDRQTILGCGDVAKNQMGCVDFLRSPCRDGEGSARKQRGRAG